MPNRGNGACQAIGGCVDRPQESVTQRHIAADQVGQSIDRAQGILEGGEQGEEGQMVGRESLAGEDSGLADKRAVKKRKAEVTAVLKIVPSLNLLRDQG